jgi:2-hydroxy-3-keto-5-methylthiopentenyl-1-phosphate phosphatase
MKELIVISDFDKIIAEEDVASLLFEGFECLIHKEFNKIRYAGVLDYKDTLTACVKYIKATPKELNEFALSHTTAREGLRQFKNLCNEYEVSV